MQSPSQPQSLSERKAHLKTLTVEELVIEAQSDNQSMSMMALEELVKRHQRTVYVMLYQLAPERQDLADLTQDVLLRMCRSIKSLRNPKTFKFWLNRIVTNLFYDELRKTPRRIQASSLDEPQFESDGDNAPSRDIPDTREAPETITLNTELDKQIQKAIHDLPEQFRTIIVLREIQGLSYDEIAELTNANIGTVKSRLARARLRLQEVLLPYLRDQQQ